MICGIFEEHKEREEKSQLKVTIHIHGTDYVLRSISIFPTKIKFD
jgi:hypothetical protein